MEKMGKNGWKEETKVVGKNEQKGRERMKGRGTRISWSHSRPFYSLMTLRGKNHRIFFPLQVYSFLPIILFSPWNRDGDMKVLNGKNTTGNKALKRLVWEIEREREMKKEKEEKEKEIWKENRFRLDNILDTGFELSVISGTKLFKYMPWTHISLKAHTVQFKCMYPFINGNNIWTRKKGGSWREVAKKKCHLLSFTFILLFITSFFLLFFPSFFHPSLFSCFKV